MRTDVKPHLVFVDADNTLWDTDQIYASAQLELLNSSQARYGGEVQGDPLAFVRAVDQALAKRHHDGLRYPPKLLVRGLQAALAGETPERAARKALLGQSKKFPEVETFIVDQFFEMLAEVPALRVGVRDGLRHLANHGIGVVVLTEGAREKVIRVADRLGIKNEIARFFEGRKRVRLFERFKRFAGPGSPLFVIGDQLDRDIDPAQKAGLKTIYFPGGFRPKWSPLVEEVQPSYVVDNFLVAAEIVSNATQAALSSGR